MNQLFRGWGHTIQHLFYGPYIYFIVEASKFSLPKACDTPT